MKISTKHSSFLSVLSLIGLFTLALSPQAKAISKILECQEARSGPDQIEIEAFVDSQNLLYRMDVNSVSDSAPNPTHLSSMVKDATPPKSADIRGLFRSRQFELSVGFDEGRTSDGDEGYKGVFKVLTPQAKEPIDVICWFAKRASVESPSAPVASTGKAEKSEKPTKPVKKVAVEKSEVSTETKSGIKKSKKTS